MPLLILIQSQDKFPELWRSIGKVRPGSTKFYVIEPTIKPRRDVELQRPEQEQEGNVQLEVEVIRIEVQPVNLGNNDSYNSYEEETNF